MEGNKFCPMVKDDCKKDQCAWWDEDFEACAVLSIMLALWAEADEDEDEDEEVEGEGMKIIIGKPEIEE